MTHRSGYYSDDVETTLNAASLPPPPSHSYQNETYGYNTIGAPPSSSLSHVGRTHDRHYMTLDGSTSHCQLQEPGSYTTHTSSFRSLDTAAASHHRHHSGARSRCRSDPDAVTSTGRSRSLNRQDSSTAAQQLEPCCNDALHCHRCRQAAAGQCSNCVAASRPFDDAAANCCQLQSRTFPRRYDAGPPPPAASYRDHDSTNRTDVVNVGRYGSSGLLQMTDMSCKACAHEMLTSHSALAVMTSRGGINSTRESSYQRSSGGSVDRSSHTRGAGGAHVTSSRDDVVSSQQQGDVSCQPYGFYRPSGNTVRQSYNRG